MIYELLRVSYCGPHHQNFVLWGNLTGTRKEKGLGFEAFSPGVGKRSCNFFELKDLGMWTSTTFFAYTNLADLFVWIPGLNGSMIAVLGRARESGAGLWWWCRFLRTAALRPSKRVIRPVNQDMGHPQRGNRQQSTLIRYHTQVAGLKMRFLFFWCVTTKTGIFNPAMWVPVLVV